MTTEGEFNLVNDEVKDIWEANADFWDQNMGEGNAFHNVLVKPAQLRLLDIREGDSILDIGCGNGQFARTMAELGADVLATDISPSMIYHARKRTESANLQIEFQVIDASEESQLISLGVAHFDSIVCTMAIFDIADIVPLVEAVPKLLKPKGRFVFSLLHPAFNSPVDVEIMAGNRFDNGRTETRYRVSLSQYKTPVRYRTVAMNGQPLTQYVFHRPLSDVFNQCFSVGLYLDGLEEPVFTDEVPSTGRISWEDLRDIPPVLVARMIRP